MVSCSSLLDWLVGYLFFIVGLVGGLAGGVLVVYCYGKCMAE